MIWHFTLVLIKINYGQIGDQTGLFTKVFPDRIDFYRIFPSYRHVWESLIFSLVPLDNRIYKIYLSDVSFHRYRTNANVDTYDVDLCFYANDFLHDQFFKRVRNVMIINTIGTTQLGIPEVMRR